MCGTAYMRAFGELELGVVNQQLAVRYTPGISALLYVKEENRDVNAVLY